MWAETVPVLSVFRSRFHKAITHEARLKCSSQMVSEFVQQIGFLGEKLGPILVQLPPSLEFECSAIDKFLSLLRQNYQGEVVCEPRHVSWFEERPDSLLREYQIVRVALPIRRARQSARARRHIGIQCTFGFMDRPGVIILLGNSDVLKTLSSQLIATRDQIASLVYFRQYCDGIYIPAALELKIGVSIVTRGKIKLRCGAV